MHVLLQFTDCRLSRFRNARVPGFIPAERLSVDQKVSRSYTVSELQQQWEAALQQCRRGLTLVSSASLLYLSLALDRPTQCLASVGAVLQQ